MWVKDRKQDRVNMTSIVDIFNTIPKVRDTGIHLKVDEEQMEDHTRK